MDFKRIRTTADALAQKIDIQELLASLDFTDEQVAEASTMQPALFLTGAIYRVQKMRRKQRLEAKLKLIRSDHAKYVRQRLQELGKRVTDKEVEENISRKKDVTRLSDKIDSASQQEEFAKLLLEALRMRAASLKIIESLIGAEVYVSRKNEGSDTYMDDIKSKLAKKYPGRVRKEERRRRK